MTGRALRNARRIEITIAGIVDEAVLQPVLGVAAGVDGFGNELHLLDRHRRIGQYEAVPETLRDGVDEGEHGGTGDDAVEVGRKPLRRDEALTAARRAAVPVGVGRGAPVIGGGDALSLRRGQVHGAKGVVDALLRVRRERSNRLGRRIMPRVRAGGDEAVAQRRGPIAWARTRVGRLAGEAAVAMHIKAPVLRRQIDSKRISGAMTPVICQCSGTPSAVATTSAVRLSCSGRHLAIPALPASPEATA